MGLAHPGLLLQYLLRHLPADGNQPQHDHPTCLHFDCPRLSNRNTFAFPNPQFAFYYTIRPENLQSLVEQASLGIAILIHLGWATILTFWSVSVTLVNFEISLPGRVSIWGLGTLGVMFLLFSLSSIIYGDFIPALVFHYFLFGLFHKFNYHYPEGIFWHEYG